MAIYQGTPESFNNLRSEMRAQDEPLQLQIDLLKNQIQSLNTVVNVSKQNFAEIANILDNSHPEWSKAAYLAPDVSPGDAGDDNQECYNWHRIERTATTFSKTSANALKSSGHSLFAAVEGANENIPRWDRTNGYVEIGGDTEHWDLLYQLPTNLVSPGMVFYFQFEAMLRAGSAIPADLQIFADFYDTTAGQEKVVEGGSFAITGEIFGDQSGSETVRYQVVAKTDAGDEAVSNVLELANAPAAFSQNNHPRINLDGAPGFIIFDIYREFGGEFHYVFQVKNSIDAQFFDTDLNQFVREVSALPSLSATPPKAHAQTRVFAPGTLSSMGFVRHSLTIFVPTTYNKSLTGAGQQWLRVGILGLCDEGPRQILLRRLGLSQGEAQWARSANDLLEGAHSTPTVSPASAPPGSAGIGVQEPPPFGSGGVDCVLLDTKINVRCKNGFSKINLSELKQDAFVDSAGAIFGRVTKVKTAYASRIYRITTKNGLEIGCTPEHPFITSGHDTYGTPAVKLKKRFDRGDRVTVLTKSFETIEEAEIVSVAEEFGSFAVGIPVQYGSHVFVANGFLCDNRKDDSYLAFL